MLRLADLREILRYVPQYRDRTFVFDSSDNCGFVRRNGGEFHRRRVPGAQSVRQKSCNRSRPFLMMSMLVA